MERIFHVSRHTVPREAIQPYPSIEDTLLPADETDVLELDELVCADQKRWLWLALCRRTRQIVDFIIGDRSAKSCVRLRRQIPAGYKGCHIFSDFWQAYQVVFDAEIHTSVGKESGETAHIERFNGTLRQRWARFVRKTLSFSKSDGWHHIVTKPVPRLRTSRASSRERGEWFIIEYNLDILRRHMEQCVIPISRTR